MTHVHCSKPNLLAALYYVYAASDLLQPMPMPVIDQALHQKVCMQAMTTCKAVPLLQILASSLKQCAKTPTGCHSLLQTSRSLHLIDAHQTVVLTALNKQQRVKTVQNIGQMPFTEFSALYAVSLSNVAIGSLVTLTHLCNFCLTSKCVWQNCLMPLSSSGIWSVHEVLSRLAQFHP